MKNVRSMFNAVMKATFYHATPPKRVMQNDGPRPPANPQNHCAKVLAPATQTNPLFIVDIFHNVASELSRDEDPCAGFEALKALKATCKEARNRFQAGGIEQAVFSQAKQNATHRGPVPLLLWGVANEPLLPKAHLQWFANGRRH